MWDICALNTLTIVDVVAHCLVLSIITYRESASTLEAESGYMMEASEVSEFRKYILEASWGSAEDALTRLGVTDSDGLWVCACFTSWLPVLHIRYQEAKFFIGQQKYLELLEAGRTTSALQVLRNELAPLNVAQDQLHFLSGYAHGTF
jgi:hypothetical protein